jgi:hypothetical protein
MFATKKSLTRLIKAPKRIDLEAFSLLEANLWTILEVRSIIILKSIRQDKEFFSECEKWQQLKVNALVLNTKVPYFIF